MQVLVAGIRGSISSRFRDGFFYRSPRWRAAAFSVDDGARCAFRRCVRRVAIFDDSFKPGFKNFFRFFNANLAKMDNIGNLVASVLDGDAIYRGRGGVGRSQKDGERGVWLK